MSIEEVALWFDVRGIKRDYVLIQKRDKLIDPAWKDKRIIVSDHNIALYESHIKCKPCIVPFDILRSLFGRDKINESNMYFYNDFVYIFKYPSGTLHTIHHEKDLLMKRVANIDNFAEAIKTKILQQDQTNG